MTSGADGESVPEFFLDLNFDQIVDSVTRSRDEYDLVPFFCTPLDDIDTVAYRHEVFRDLERLPVYDLVGVFAGAMRTMRSRLNAAAKLRYPYQKERWYLNAVDAYCDAVTVLACGLAEADVRSRGLLGLGDYLLGYTRSKEFTTLREQVGELQRGLGAVRYCLLIKGNRITVGHYDDEADYSDEVGRTFHRFRQHDPKDHRITFPTPTGMDHVEAGILDLVARLYPDLFGALDDFCAGNSDYLDPTIGRFDREVQFYLAYLDYLSPLQGAGLSFTYPQVSAQSKKTQARETFDLALATKLTPEKAPVVCNDFYLTGQERVLVVSGPNQGGKTTLARTFGQLHYLARLGCPVPGRDVRLFLTDQILTHFEKEEDLDTLAGKLQDELQRIHTILQRATPASIIILNEIFTSTTLSDALFLSREVLGRISRLDALCVCVTFLDELSTLNAKTVSMVSTVRPDDPAIRTHKLIRKPADGRAYAHAIAEKYGLTYDRLKGRIIR